MTSLKTSTIAGDTTAAVAARVATKRWWLAVSAGVLTSIPLGLLLSYAATLMMLIGLFFFALFGLVIGAVMYRVGAPARPIGSGWIKIGVVVVVFVAWGVSYSVEVRDFPYEKANHALRSVSPLPDGMTRDDFHAEVVRFIRQSLTKRYGGSGPIGYARWAMSGDRIEYAVATMPKPVVFIAMQGRWTWTIRVILSIALLVFGIASQVTPLTKAVEGPEASESDASS